MKSMLKMATIITATVLLISGSVMAAPIMIVNNNIPLEETGQSGRVAWDQGNIEAIGTGVAPGNVGLAQGHGLARRAAIVDAYRNLTELIQGVQVDSTTTMENLMISSDTVKTKVTGLIRGARIIRELPQADGSYQVVMRINLYGPNSMAEVALNAVQPAETGQISAQIPEQIVQASKPIQEKPAVTGIIIDARKLGLEPSFSPQIYDESGRIVYGNMSVSGDYAVSQGMVEYALTPDRYEAAINGQSRAGSSPLSVKAIGVRDNNCNVIISNADAETIISANATLGIFKKCAVVFSL